MLYKTILLILLFLKIQNISWSQQNLVFEKNRLEYEIDSIVANAIIKRAFPGCVVYSLYNEDEIFHKSYGHHTYDSLVTTSEDDIFDLASITKVTASTLALMKLYEEEKFQLDERLGKYISGLSRKMSKVTFREALAHQAGFEGWIKFYEKYKKKNGNYRRKTLAKTFSEKYPFQISNELFLYKEYQIKIKKEIRRSKVNDDKVYHYSGLFFYLIPELIEKISGSSYQDYLANNFYKPLNAKSLCFNPINKVNFQAIVPTEVDSFFRMDSIRGRVHDEGAMLMNGISGNAGLFSNAEDLGKVWIMLLNGGSYNGIKYLEPATIQLFTSYQYPNNQNRRGLGFDKPLLEYDSLKSSVAKSASILSFGHTGYTGTLVWADPASGLLFIFLSNRVYPSRENKEIYRLNVRPAIHEKLYDYIEQ